MKKLYDENEVIEALSEWIKQNPLIGFHYEIEDYFFNFIKDENQKKAFIEKYRTLKKQYDWLRTKKSRGQLTEEQISRCKEANIGGVFGYSEKIEIMAKKCDISIPDLLSTISKYESLENYYDAVINNGDDNRYAKLIIKSVHDIEMNDNVAYDNLARLMIMRHEQSLPSKELYCYSKTKMDEIIATLGEKERQVIRLRYGLDDGKIHRTLEDVGKLLGIERLRVRQIEGKAIRKLNYPTRFNKLFYVLNTDELDVSKEDLIELKNAVRKVRISRTADEETIKANNTIKQYLIMGKTLFAEVDNPDNCTEIEDDIDSYLGIEKQTKDSNSETIASINDMKRRNTEMKESIEDKKETVKLLETLLALACEHDMLKVQESKLDKKIEEKLAALSELGIKYGKNNK